MQQIKVRSPEKNLALDRAHFKLNAATIDPMYPTCTSKWSRLWTHLTSIVLYSNRNHYVKHYKKKYRSHRFIFFTDISSNTLTLNSLVS